MQPVEHAAPCFATDQRLDFGQGSRGRLAPRRRTLDTGLGIEPAATGNIVDLQAPIAPDTGRGTG